MHDWMQKRAGRSAPVGLSRPRCFKHEKCSGTTAYAFQLAEEYQSKFSLFHLVDPGLEEGDERRNQFLEAVTKELGGSRIPSTAWRLPVTAGALDKAITRHAEETSADLIVMGALPHTLLKRHFLYGTSSRVIHSAPCPVMIVHR